MDTILTIINVAIALAVLTILIYASKGAETISQPQPRAGYKHSALERRRKSLELATKEWNRKLSRGHIFLAGEQKHLVDQLEREVAAMENELFDTTEEEPVAPKPEAPENEPVAVIRCGCHEPCKVLYYKAQCSFCEWSGSSFSKETAEARRVKHEMRHA